MGVKTSFDHVQIYVSNCKVSFLFYKKLLTYLGYTVVHEDATHLGMRNGSTDIWFKEVSKEHKIPKYHRKKVGVNHLAFKVFKKSDVNKFNKEFLVLNKIKSLYNTPKNFPEYTNKYYAVFFEDPDRIKLEVVFL